MDIANVSQPRVQQNGDWWTFQIEYTATFNQDKLNHGYIFVDNARLMEHDTSDDDIIVNRLGEEVYLEIGLRNRTTGAAGVTRRSPFIQVSPG